MVKFAVKTSTKSYAMLQASIKPHERKTKSKPPKLDKWQHAAINTARVRTNNIIKGKIQGLLTELKTQAKEIAEAHGKTERWVLDMVFNGGKRLVKPRSKTNPYNAFKHFKAQEIRDTGGKVPTIARLDEICLAPYQALSEKEREDFVLRYDVEKAVKEANKLKIALPNIQAQAQDVANVAANMTALMKALALRVGIEGMFLLVRNRGDPFMAPIWGWTSKKLEGYMPLAVKGGWDTEKVGGHIEAFAVAGCDTANMAQTGSKKAHSYRTDIRDLFNTKLAEVTGLKGISMDYKHFDHKIKAEYQVELEGYPLAKFCAPGELGSALGPLRTLKNALLEGTCYFRKMEPEEFREWHDKYKRDCESGEIPAPDQKTRSDAGKPRGPRKKKSEDVEMKDGNEDRNDVVINDGDDENLASGPGVVEPDSSKAVKTKTNQAKGKAAKDLGEKEKKAKAAKMKKQAKVPAKAPAKVPTTAGKKVGKSKSRPGSEETDAPTPAVPLQRSPPPPNRPRPKKVVPNGIPNAPSTFIPTAAAENDDEETRGSDEREEPSEPPIPLSEADQKLLDAAKRMPRRMDGLDPSTIVSTRRITRTRVQGGGASFGS
ncbi:hypothetical protein V5O48_018476 [Marasmius crinis-equi]|uniref:Uncharacterized protein n=1 Tax=Marasmius crinis-equi TaxID=585013 RepID=A0ABR3EL24_9AGAR